MEEEKSSKGAIVVIIIIIAIIYFWADDNKKSEDVYEKLISENEQLQEANAELQARIYDYDLALQEANGKIEKLNYQIINTQDSAWSSYQEMGDAIDYLETLDTVDTP